VSTVLLGARIGSDNDPPRTSSVRS
jgi:hypothetical protein